MKVFLNSVNFYFSNILMFKCYIAKIELPIANNLLADILS